MRRNHVNEYLFMLLYNVYILEYFVKRSQFEAMLKSPILLFSKVHQSCSNHGTGISEKNLFLKVSFHREIFFVSLAILVSFRFMNFRHSFTPNGRCGSRQKLTYMTPSEITTLYRGTFLSNFKGLKDLGHPV